MDDWEFLKLERMYLCTVDVIITGMEKMHANRKIQDEIGLKT